MRVTTFRAQPLTTREWRPSSTPPVPSDSTVVFVFGAYELDRKTLELRRDGRPLHIEPKVFDVLGHLLEHRQRVVTKDELLERFWPGVNVTEAGLSRGRSPRHGECSVAMRTRVAS